MRIETKAKLIVWTLAAMLVYVVFARWAYGGAPIPLGAPSIVGEDRVPVVNPCCVFIYTANKQWRNDRVFASSFQ